MPKRAFLFALLVVLIASVPRPAEAQTWSDSQQEVWTIILESWDAITARDATWSDRYVHPSAAVWSMDYPMPRTRDDVKRWDSFNFPSETILNDEYNLAALVVEGSTAVAHYYYSTGVQDAEGDRETTHGRCTDILIRSEGTWKFIAWNCTDEDDDD
jgi:hypothetical protein